VHLKVLFVSLHSAPWHTGWLFICLYHDNMLEVTNTSREIDGELSSLELEKGTKDGRCTS
jgi:hypothetical protein